MTCAFPGAQALDYQTCSYGSSKLLYRGPRRTLDGPFCAVLGSSEAFGKFVSAPFPALLEQNLGLPVVNFATMNAGLDVFLSEGAVLDACGKALVTVVQLPGAQNMSNRFYAVHPRRNDRFLRASAMMKSIYPEVDFTEFTFTRHMLSTLRARAPEKFRFVEQELRASWLARMRQVLQRIAGPVVLLWLESYHAPHRAPDGLGEDPLFVSENMVAALAAGGTRVIRLQPSMAARLAGRDGMHYTPFDAAAAAELPGPAIHQEVAAALLPVLRGYCPADAA